MIRLSVEELVEINDFYNGAAKVTITYAVGGIVQLKLVGWDGIVDDFILSKRDLIMVLRNFYIEDIYDIVLSAISEPIEVKVDESVKYYPVQITVEDGYKYYCNIEELKYIRRIIKRQKDRLFN